MKMTVLPAQHECASNSIESQGNTVHLRTKEVIGAVPCEREGGAFVIAVEGSLDDEWPVRADGGRRAFYFYVYARSVAHAPSDPKSRARASRNSTTSRREGDMPNVLSQSV